MRGCHLAPWLEGSDGGALDREAGLSPPLPARLFIEADAQELHLELLDLRTLLGRDRRQQPGGRVEGTVGVVARKRLLVRPPVSVTPQLAHEASFGRPQDLAEHVVPRLPHQLEERGHVPLDHTAIPYKRVFDEPLQRRGIYPLRLESAVHFALDERSKPCLQRLERLADAFMIRYCHIAYEFNRILGLIDCNSVSGRDCTATFDRATRGPPTCAVNVAGVTAAPPP